MHGAPIITNAIIFEMKAPWKKRFKRHTTRTGASTGSESEACVIPERRDSFTPPHRTKHGETRPGFGLCLQELSYAFIKEQRSRYSQPSGQRFQQSGSRSLCRERFDLCSRRNKVGVRCIQLELGAREIIGQSAGANKNAELVRKAFSMVKGNLFDIQIFRTNRGSEFDNMLIDELFDSFQINRSLNMKGCPYDNAAVESNFKMIKAEFVYSRRFETLRSTGWSCWIMFTVSTTSVYTEH
ncbi:MAG: hypothetical protein ABFC73_00265 [Clostridiaceae bacterium]